MAASKDIAVIIGSLRKESFCRSLALALTDLAPAGMKLRLVEIGALPLYNEDLDKDQPPVSWQTFRDEVRPADGVLFVTPEYNRSVPAPLKNAIDVGSRPYGKSVWDKKPAAIISLSPGALGAFGANHHLRQSLVFLNMPILQQPEAYIGNAASLFDDNRKLAKKETGEFLGKFLAAFDALISRTVSV